MSPTPDTKERGQVLAIFALALVAIVAMTGLVLDGGSTFVQRRDMQNVADAAAMAGAYDYVNNASSSSALAAAQNIAAANGFANGTDGVVVDARMSWGINGARTVVVSITKPHRNSFSGIVGLASWDVTTTATAQGGAPNAAIGAMPLIFNKKGFPSGNGPTSDTSFDEPGTGSQDVPQTARQFNWTVYCTANGGGNGGCNGDSNTVDNLINNNGHSAQVDLTDDIGPLNAGAHATLFSSLAAHVGEEFPVCIVDDEGGMAGWAMFHLTGSVGGSTKQIRGYFVAPVNESSIYIAEGGGSGTSAYGTYEVKLVN